MNSDFSRVQGADVILLFIESYGAVTFDRPDFAEPLEDARRTLERGDRRDGPRQRLGVRRVADLRRRVVARAHLADVGRRGARPAYERGPDDPAPRHDRQRVLAPRLPEHRQHARVVVGLAGRIVLWLRRHLRGAAPRLSRSAIRVVHADRSVRARPHRRAGDRAAAPAAAVHVLPDRQHACAVHADASVSTGLGTHVRRDAVRSRRSRSQLPRRRRLAGPRARATSRPSTTRCGRSPATCGCGPIAISS